MIIGAAAGQVPIIRKVKALGYEAIVVSREGRYPGFDEADQKVFIDIFEKERIASLARELRVAGVLTAQSELCLPTVSCVTNRLGLPGVPEAVVNVFTNKRTIQERCLTRKVPVPESWRISDFTEFENRFAEIEYPIIVKPSDNAGSQGVQYVACPNSMNVSGIREVYEKTMACSRSGVIIIEQFIRGKEIVVEALLVNGSVLNLMCGESYNIDFPGVFVPSKRLFPAELSDDLVASIYDYNENLYSGLDGFFSVTQAEYIISESDNKPYLIDAHIRGGGGYIESHIVPLVCGIDADELSIRAAVGETIKTPVVSRQQSHAGYVTFLLPKGRLVDTFDAGRIDGISGVDYHGVRGLEAGRELPAPTYKGARFGPIVIKGKSREELMSVARSLREMITLRVETSDGIRGACWE